MKKNTASSIRSTVLDIPLPLPQPSLAEALEEVQLSVERFCLLAGLDALAAMMEDDVTALCGARHGRSPDRRGWRWGRTVSEVDFHGGKVKVRRPRVRDRDGHEMALERC